MYNASYTDKLTHIIFKYVVCVKWIVMVEKASYGGFCSWSNQCTHSTVCENERCTCKQGFIFINSDCHESK